MKRTQKLWMLLAAAVILLAVLALSGWWLYSHGEISHRYELF